MDDIKEELEKIVRRVILIVLKQDVKTVKTALERFGKLDRSVKITPEIQDHKANDSNALTRPLYETRTGRRTKRLGLRGSIVTEEHQPTAWAENDEAIQTSTASSSEHIDDPSNNFLNAEWGNPTSEKTAEHRMRIPTTIPYPFSEDGKNKVDPEQTIYELKSKIVNDLGLQWLSLEILLSYYSPISTECPPTQKNPLQKALKEALGDLPEYILSDLGLTSEALVDAFPEGYSIYKPMLLLPHNAFTSLEWKSLITIHPISSSPLQPIWKHIASALCTTHIAINSPIPLQTTTQSHNNDNILRSPVNLTPIYGDFGPAPTSQTLTHPTRHDFAHALWVSTTQNGIHQTWAPLYTMFSRGNMREKTRLLHLPSITSSSHTPCAAVDLYAGIGYFAFSYKKAGITAVLCFEINPWSVEGLRKGAEMNGWSCTILREDDVLDMELQLGCIVSRQHGQNGVLQSHAQFHFHIFHMSNQRALSILSTRFKTVIPPVRHVNLGLLPTSRDTWRAAVRLIDAERGGWMHAHENVGVKEIADREREVEKDFQRYLDGVEEEAGGEWRRKAKVEHVERVKMYAPGVVHCVFDVHVQGREDVELEGSGRSLNPT